MAEDGVVLQISLLTGQTFDLIFKGSQHINKRNLLGYLHYAFFSIHLLSVSFLLLHTLLFSLSLLFLVNYLAYYIFFVYFHLVYEYFQRGQLHLTFLGYIVWHQS